MNPKLDAFFTKAKKWQAEMKQLRAIVLSCPLTEDLKWGKPCYSFQDQNVVLIVPFKTTCALLLCKGALLKDPHGILIKPGEHTQAARQIRFTSVRDIVEKKLILKAYLENAVAAEKAGLQVDYKEKTALAPPEEFQRQLAGNPALKAAFEALTPGRRRMYNIHFSAPKQSQTRESRIKKCIPQILKGKGLTDDYTRRKDK